MAVFLIARVHGHPANKKGIEAESQETTFVLDDVGCLVTRENSGISGKVHIVKNSNQFWISNFNFDGGEKEVYFNIGQYLYCLL